MCATGQRVRTGFTYGGLNRFPSVFTFTSAAGDNAGILLFGFSACGTKVLGSIGAVPLMPRLPSSLLLSSLFLLKCILEKFRGLLGDVRVRSRLKFGSAPQAASGIESTGVADISSSSVDGASTWTACFLRLETPEEVAMVMRSTCSAKIRNFVCKLILFHAKPDFCTKYVPSASVLAKVKFVD